MELRQPCPFAYNVKIAIYLRVILIPVFHYGLLCTAAVEPTKETPEHCNDIINHASVVGGHLRMDHAVRAVPDFLDNSIRLMVLAACWTQIYHLC